MQSFDLIFYKYQHGVYDIKHMLSLVDKGIISPQDFFEITRFSYSGFKNSKE